MRYLNSDNLCSKDYKIFQEIEKLRSEIVKEDIEIDIVDYGASSPDAALSKEEMDRGVRKKSPISKICSIGVKGEHAKKLYSYSKSLSQRSKILELGTCCGFSTLYLASANSSGEIHTIEGSEEIAKIASQNFKRFNSLNIRQYIGKFRDLLPEILPKLSQIDLAFIDGHHDRCATIEYFETIEPYIRSGGFMIFDDITWSKGMKKAWEHISRDKRVLKIEDDGKLGVVRKRELF